MSRMSRTSIAKVVLRKAATVDVEAIEVEIAAVAADVRVVAGVVVDAVDAAVDVTAAVAMADTGDTAEDGTKPIFDC